MSTEGRYFIRTYGCQMNEHDSEKLAGVLKDIGYKPADELAKADVIILNTCCVRENAELKVFGKLGEIKQIKKENPGLIVGICGCMMQQEEVVNKIKQRYNFVDIVFGTHNIHRFPELLQEIKAENQSLVEVWDDSREVIGDMPTNREEDHKAKVNIIHGCDNYCTYCIVPYVRGSERSRSQEDIIKEIKKLVADGVKEVMLLGQNVNSYGKDLGQDLDFADLLTAVNKIKGLPRIRFMTSHPRDFSDKLIEAVTNLENVCEHFHLPIQSGSDKLLKKMNRGYTKEEYLDLVTKLKAKNPKAAISTDLIVGFPGETEEDFAETMELYKQVRFDRAFTFIYSKRTGTPAAKMEEQVPEEKKKERHQRLLDLQSKIGLEENKKLKGEIVEVLVDGPSKKDPNKLSGRTRTDKIVIIESDQDLTGEIINVKINKAQSWTLFGKIVN
ncbi:tRNA-N(6)-(isopentenyl)adenosine-37 thiotransferase enzyme MiaB [Halobacteroides halobius DSM 5150]|uniref:tRNA-2-methylthio-N(6)-dimethylallyladenosine synthase n=1 Tax=Halobacteroides halobius (strain ATCC 35273 / DSM 5150 / MD-1) TaxID=748449 RepID=L0K9Z3_HALHC|nr:tRNA (N6-isopentenyl adenosine(37)-C2)-methylthiotransferase MiaB [Halobacteroides halobius]AGB40923.1 tRNA-N(6)-(isopentenyl)adenosine-37 thiotransferase enzyme MiaB [Halobacteroides halobius DSM 5150]